MCAIVVVTNMFAAIPIPGAAYMPNGKMLLHTPRTSAGLALA